MVKRFKDPASVQKVSIASPTRKHTLQDNYVSPEPEDPAGVPASQLTPGTESGPDSTDDVETFELRPEDIESWDPQLHPLHADVLFYEPGWKLVYEHRYDFTNVVARFVGALVLGWLVGLFLQQIQWSVVIALSVIGVIELIRWKSGHYESTRWEWDWRNRSLREIVGEDQFEYDFSEIKEIILKLTKTEHRWTSLLSGSGKLNRFYSFNAHTLVSGPDEETFEIASTGELQRHPDEVKYLGLCFAFMLAQQLNVPLRIQELPTPL